MKYVEVLLYYKNRVYMSNKSKLKDTILQEFHAVPMAEQTDNKNIKEVSNNFFGRG